MNIDFDKLSDLSSSDEVGFQREKNRLVREYINSLPEDRRSMVIAIQEKIDEELNSVAKEERLQTITKMMISSVSDMTLKMTDLTKKMFY